MVVAQNWPRRSEDHTSNQHTHLSEEEGPRARVVEGQVCNIWTFLGRNWHFHPPPSPERRWPAQPKLDTLSSFLYVALFRDARTLIWNLLQVELDCWTRLLRNMTCKMVEEWVKSATCCGVLALLYRHENCNTLLFCLYAVFFVNVWSVSTKTELNSVHLVFRSQMKMCKTLATPLVSEFVGLTPSWLVAVRKPLLA